MELSMNTLLIKVCVILVICADVTSPACIGVSTTWCSLTNQQYVGVAAPAPIIGPSQSTCQNQCLTSPTCKAVTHNPVTKSCTLYDTNHLAAGTLLPMNGLNYLYFVCGTTTCPEGSAATTTTTVKVTPSTTVQTTPSTTPSTTPATAKTTTTTAKTATTRSTSTEYPGMENPGYKPDPIPGDKLSPNEFWIWVRDHPEWFALIGFGLVVFIQFWIIMYLFYRIKSHKKKSDD